MLKLTATSPEVASGTDRSCCWRPARRRAKVWPAPIVVAMSLTSDDEGLVEEQAAGVGGPDHDLVARLPFVVEHAVVEQ